MSKVPTQEQRVLQYIKDFGSITRGEALLEISVANLTAVINTLRKKGFPIVTNTIKSRNKYGQPISYAEYVIDWSQYALMTDNGEVYDG